jgi:hypothetical protein
MFGSTGAETERLSSDDKGALAKMRADSPAVALPAKAYMATGASKKPTGPAFSSLHARVKIRRLSCACSGYLARALAVIRR